MGNCCACRENVGRKIFGASTLHRFDIETGTKQDYYVCPKCAAPRENGVTDFCIDSVLHKVLRARKLTPLDEKRIMTI
jgi:protein-arginine kinase activator protein McsA